MIYIYTAIFTPRENDPGYYAEVPDLPECITTGKDIADAIFQITDTISAWLVAAEDKGVEIIPPTPQNKLHINSNTICSLITADTMEYRARTDNHSVRKNVSLPCWMVNLADKRRINCSKVLQDALRRLFDNQTTMSL